MPVYHRLAVVVPAEDGRFLAGVLPLAEEGQLPAMKDIENFHIRDERTEQLFVVNYANYYIISPGSFEKHTVPPPPAPMALDENDSSGLPRYTYDLLPCPKTFQPFTDLAVCVESMVKEAVLLHPERAQPNDQERRVTIEDFGTISLTGAAKESYEWKAWIEPDKRKLSRLMGSKFVKRFSDANGEYYAGTFKPPA